MKKTGLPQYAITIRRNVRVKAAEGVDLAHSPRGQNQWLGRWVVATWACRGVIGADPCVLALKPT